MINFNNKKSSQTANYFKELITNNAHNQRKADISNREGNAT